MGVGAAPATNRGPRSLKHLPMIIVLNAPSAQAKYLAVLSSRHYFEEAREVFYAAASSPSKAVEPLCP